MKRLDNKVAIVTGASKGIGAGIAKAFAAEGAAVIVNYAHDQAGAERVVREIIGEKVTMFVTESRVHAGRCFVVARVTGAYDKTGLPDPLTLRFYFCLDEAGLISQLIIIPSKTA